MLDFFFILSKGGLVLWYFHAEALALDTIQAAINEFIKFSIIDKNKGIFHYNKMALEIEQDNEFDLIYVVGYQNFLQLSYIDKLLSDVKRKFRDIYKNDLENGIYSHLNNSFSNFGGIFHKTLNQIESTAKTAGPKKARKFQDSEKAVKSVKGSGLIETKESRNEREQLKKQTEDDELEKNRQKMRERFSKTASPGGARQKKEDKIDKKGEKKSKAPRKWLGEGKKKDMDSLDYSDNKLGHDEIAVPKETNMLDMEHKGTMMGAVKGLEVEEIDLSEDHDDAVSNGKKSSVFSMFRGLIGQKELTEESMKEVLEKYKLHLISKNVATEIAEKIIEAVSLKLVGKTIGTFSSIKTAIFNGIEESLVQILTPRRRVDILRDVLHAKSEGRPYTITFCGVNGVGKSTNLAKIAFWLVENGFKIMIAACDTFRAGAVEQLRTHVHRINAIHPDKVELFEQGYGKDAATIAMHSISAARDLGYDVVLVDTAGRMQDNEPLMRALSKLIAINRPDAVLFVGEALVGNDAVDQLSKFNQALANHSQSKDPRLIDGIVLSKFDTIDDKVGAAISMTYTTGQPIVFIGTGQTYKDLNSLNPRAVVNILLR